MEHRNTPPLSRGEQQRARQAAQYIRELAVLLRGANLAIGRLEQVNSDIWPVLPQYGPDSLIGDDLYGDLIAWRWAIDRAEDLLRANFTHEVQQALIEAGLEDDGDDDHEDDDRDDDDPDDPDDTPDAPASDVYAYQLN
ncbi:MAG TPA: hypothetical protein VN688_04565 [Gemmataceae bacterium]|nr:hypothetical protein [Gemmataceae bacterium]